jgi:hypothetical protein
VIRALSIDAGIVRRIRAMAAFDIPAPMSRKGAGFPSPACPSSDRRLGPFRYA